MFQSQPSIEELTSYPGLQAMRTRLAWTRVSLSLFGNGVLFFTYLSFPLENFALCKKILIAAFFLCLISFIIGFRRKAILSLHPLPKNLAANFSLLFVGLGIFAFCVAVLGIMIAKFFSI